MMVKYNSLYIYNNVDYRGLEYSGYWLIYIFKIESKSVFRTWLDLAMTFWNSGLSECGAPKKSSLGSFGRIVRFLVNGSVVSKLRRCSMLSADQT